MSYPPLVEPAEELSVEDWGRLADAAGYSGAKLIEGKLDISYNTVPAMTAGKPHPDLKPKWKEVVKNRRFTITLDLHLGRASFRLQTALGSADVHLQVHGEHQVSNALATAAASAAARASRPALSTPRSVISPVTRRAGVTSKA